MSHIEKLVIVQWVGTTGEGSDLAPRHPTDTPANTPYYKVLCRDCGDVTRAESGGSLNDCTLQQGSTYQRRHLVRHLNALAEELTEANR